MSRFASPQGVATWISKISSHQKLHLRCLFFVLVGWCNFPQKSTGLLWHITWRRYPHDSTIPWNIPFVPTCGFIQCFGLSNSQGTPDIRKSMSTMYYIQHSMCIHDLTLPTTRWQNPMFSPPFRQCPKACPCDLDKASPFVRIHGSLSSSRELVPGDRKHHLSVKQTLWLWHMREDKKAGYPSPATVVK